MSKVTQATSKPVADKASRFECERSYLEEASDFARA
jgi:hypothetical protein